MTKTFVAVAMSALCILLVACKKKPSDEAKSGGQMESTKGQPDRVKVQHILVAFKGTLPGQSVERTQEEAAKLADELVAKAKDAKTDFEALVKEFSSDRPPGIYEMTNFKIEPSGGAFPREQMVPGFGEIAFQLKVGEVGVAKYDAQKSPFGFHIIKRLN